MISLQMLVPGVNTDQLLCFQQRHTGKKKSVYSIGLLHASQPLNKHPSIENKTISHTIQVNYIVIYLLYWFSDFRVPF